MRKIEEVVTLKRPSNVLLSVTFDDYEFIKETLSFIYQEEEEREIGRESVKLKMREIEREGDGEGDGRRVREKL